MKRVAIVGCGVGSLTSEAVAAIESADALFGSARMIEPYSKPKYAEYNAARIAELIRESAFERFAVLVSGDPGFYSAAKPLLESLDGIAEVTVVPGISSVSAFFAKLQLAWQDAALVSCHSRDPNIVDAVRRNRATFAVTGGNTKELAVKLCEYGFAALTVHIGENLGGTRERVFSTTVEKLATIEPDSLTVLLIENPGAYAGVRTGIPDDEFTRGDVPATKSEVRAVALSRLGIAPDSICCDVGAGTGCVTVEMALAAFNGTVYAVERNAPAIQLIRANCRKFQVGNVELVHGDAATVLAGLPPFDAVFIGGSGGRMDAIFDAVLAKNSRTRIVCNAVTLRGATAALAAFERHRLHSELVQLNVARLSSRAGMLLANNPIFIVSGGAA
ncbi:MAG: precorrin-6Y C5,15-methyltransferase (decarboxylating) subunit CbiT [Oscillospiraceae bacterium]|jgi:precorrin-6Y C5,15-methyltransferase (decarboxylating)|nr:precorrin-6Y C5,15-methyltransferase (decarboxylating) subunit CbiT [Oscillospiraceae bacterium]